MRGVVFVIITAREVPVNVWLDQVSGLKGLQEAEGQGKKEGHLGRSRLARWERRLAGGWSVEWVRVA